MTATQRQAIAGYLKWRPRIGVRELCHRIPGLPRNSTAAYVRRWRRVRRRRRRRGLQRLRWNAAGAVWAIDGTWLDEPVMDFGRRALVVVELHGKEVLTLEPVLGERVSAVLRCLEELVSRHGAPLVLKLDNGSAFTSKRLADFCRRHGIVLMHSPVRRPSYNGTCEVSGRWAKARVMAAAAARGEPDRVLPEDLQHAVTCVGRLPPVPDAERERFQAVVAEQLRTVAAERGLAPADDLADHTRRSLTRVAARRALELCHILTIEGRGYRWSLPARKAS